MKNFKIPESVQIVMDKIQKSGYEAYLVGGCVRDLLRRDLYGEPVEPKDWDVTTNAKPKESLEIFPEGKYENDFGTVMMPVKYIEGIKEEDQDNSNIEITTYRIESKYSDKRHPDEVRFAKTLEEDLSRRDFTVNALALEIRSRVLGTKSEIRNKLEIKNLKQEKRQFKIIDIFGGQEDLENKVIRAVGDPNERFDEDALRMMRAIRFVCQLSGNPIPSSRDEIRNPKQSQNSKNKIQNWEVEKKTFQAIEKNAKNLRYISQERIRDEFNKIILSSQPKRGVELLVETKLIDQFIPEIIQTIGVKQNRHHYYGPYNTVFAHVLASLEKCPSEKLEVRLAALFHDIGKPKSKRGEGEMATFHGHEYGGARAVEKIMNRMKYPRKVIDKTVLLVKNHMFYYNVDEVGESGVRRVVRKVGLENINDLIDVRIADRLGSGVPKAVPYKLRHFKYMVEKVSKDPISVKQLKIDGNDLIKELGMKPGPEIGAILEVLLAEAIEDPKLNTKNKLMSRAKELQKEKLKSLRAMAKQKIKEEQKKEDKETKGKYWVK